MEESIEIPWDDIRGNRLLVQAIERANMVGLHGKHIDDVKIKTDFGVGVNITFKTSHFVRVT